MSSQLLYRELIEGIENSCSRINTIINEKFEEFHFTAEIDHLNLNEDSSEDVNGTMVKSLHPQTIQLMESFVSYTKSIHEDDIKLIDSHAGCENLSLLKYYKDIAVDTMRVNKDLNDQIALLNQLLRNKTNECEVYKTALCDNQLLTTPPPTLATVSSYVKREPESLVILKEQDIINSQLYQHLNQQFLNLLQDVEVLRSHSIITNESITQQQNSNAGSKSNICDIFGSNMDPFDSAINAGNYYNNNSTNSTSITTSTQDSKLILTLQQEIQSLRQSNESLTVDNKQLQLQLGEFKHNTWYWEEEKYQLQSKISELNDKILLLLSSSSNNSSGNNSDNDETESDRLSNQEYNDDLIDEDGIELSLQGSNGVGVTAASIGNATSSKTNKLAISSQLANKTASPSNSRSSKRSAHIDTVVASALKLDLQDEIIDSVVNCMFVSSNPMIVDSTTSNNSSSKGANANGKSKHPANSYVDKHQSAQLSFAGSGSSGEVVQNPILIYSTEPTIPVTALPTVILRKASKDSNATTATNTTNTSTNKKRRSKNSTKTRSFTSNSSNNNLLAFGNSFGAVFEEDGNTENNGMNSSVIINASRTTTSSNINNNAGFKKHNSNTHHHHHHSAIDKVDLFDVFESLPNPFDSSSSSNQTTAAIFASSVSESAVHTSNQTTDNNLFVEEDPWSSGYDAMSGNKVSSGSSAANNADQIISPFHQVEYDATGKDVIHNEHAYDGGSVGGNLADSDYHNLQHQPHSGKSASATSVASKAKNLWKSAAKAIIHPSASSANPSIIPSNTKQYVIMTDDSRCDDNSSSASDGIAINAIHNYNNSESTRDNRSTSNASIQSNSNTTTVVKKTSSQAANANTTTVSSGNSGWGFTKLSTMFGSGNNDAGYAAMTDYVHDFDSMSNNNVGGFDFAKNNMDDYLIEHANDMVDVFITNNNLGNAIIDPFSSSNNSHLADPFSGSNNSCLVDPLASNNNTFDVKPANLTKKSKNNTSTDRVNKLNNSVATINSAVAVSASEDSNSSSNLTSSMFSDNIFMNGDPTVNPMMFGVRNDGESTTDNNQDATTTGFTATASSVCSTDVSPPVHQHITEAVQTTTNAINELLQLKQYMQQKDAVIHSLQSDVEQLQGNNKTLAAELQQMHCAMDILVHASVTSLINTTDKLSMLLTENTSNSDDDNFCEKSNANNCVTMSYRMELNSNAMGSNNFTNSNEWFVSEAPTSNAISIAEQQSVADFTKDNSKTQQQQLLVQSFQTELHRISTQLQIKQLELDAVAVSVASKEQVLSSYDLQIQLKQTELNKMQEHVQELGVETNGMSNDLVQKQQLVNELAVYIVEQEAKYNDLKVQCEVWDDATATAREAIDALNSDKALKLQQSQQLDGLVHDQQEVAAKLQLEIIGIQTKEKQCQNELAEIMCDLKVKQELYNQLSSQCTEKEALVRQLETKYQTVEGSIQQQHSQLIELKEEICHKEHTIEEVNATLEELEEELISVQHTYAEMTNKMDATTNSLTELERSKQALLTEMDMMQWEHDELAKTIQDLLSQLESEEFKSIESSIAQHSEVLTELEMKMTDASNALNSIEEEIAKKQGKLNELELAITALTEQYKSIHDKLMDTTANYATKVADLEKITTNVANKQAKFEQLSTQVSEKITQLHHIKHETEQFQTELQLVTNQLDMKKQLLVEQQQQISTSLTINTSATLTSTSPSSSSICSSETLVSPSHHVHFADPPTSSVVTYPSEDEDDEHEDGNGEVGDQEENEDNDDVEGNDSGDRRTGSTESNTKANASNPKINSKFSGVAFQQITVLQKQLNQLQSDYGNKCKEFESKIYEMETELTNSRNTLQKTRTALLAAENKLKGGGNSASPSPQPTPTPVANSSNQQQQQIQQLQHQHQQELQLIQQSNESALIQMKKQLEDKCNSIVSLNESIDEYKRDHERLMEVVEESDKKCHEVIELNCVVENKSKEKDACIQQLEGSVSELRRKIEHYSLDITTLTKSVHLKQAEIEQCQQEVAALTEKMQDQQVEMRQMQGELSIARQQLSVLPATDNEDKQEIVTLKEKMNQQKVTLEQYEQTMTQYRKTIHDQQYELQQLQSELTSVQHSPVSSTNNDYTVDTKKQHEAEVKQNHDFAMASLKETHTDEISQLKALHEAECYTYIQLQSQYKRDLEEMAIENNNKIGELNIVIQESADKIVALQNALEEATGKMRMTEKAHASQISSLKDTITTQIKEQYHEEHENMVRDLIETRLMVATKTEDYEDMKVRYLKLQNQYNDLQTRLNNNSGSNTGKSTNTGNYNNRPPPVTSSANNGIQPSGIAFANSSVNNNSNATMLATPGNYNGSTNSSAASNSSTGGVTRLFSSLVSTSGSTPLRK